MGLTGRLLASRVMPVRAERPGRAVSEPRVPARRRTRGSPALPIRAYVAVLVVGGALAALRARGLPGPPESAFPVSWWLVAAGYMASSSLAVHLHLRRDAHTVTLEEIPLAVGLTLADPGSLLLGALVGTAAALVLVRRQPPLKLACNLGLQLCSVAGCVALLHLLAGANPLEGGWGWVATALTTLLVSGLGGTLAVTAAMRLSGDTTAPARMAAILPVTLGACLLNTLLGLGGARLLSHDAVAAALLTVPCVACVVTYQLYTREHSERARLSLLYESARAFSGAHDLDAVVRTLLLRARDLLRAERAELILLPADSDGDLLRVRMEPDGPALVQAVEESGVGIQLVAGGGRVLPRGTREPAAAAALAALEARDAVVVPLRGEAGALGCLTVLDRAGDVATFSAGDQSLLETFAGQAATSLSHARVAAEIQQLAFHDALTGLPNRALLSRRLDAAIRRRAQRTGDGGGVAVAYLDLDDFKTVNDSLGHAAGDRLLVEVASRLRRSLRAGDIAARLGGDEFAVLLEDVADEEEAVTVAERLLASLRRPVNVEGVWLSTGASAGVVLVAHDAEVDAGTLLSQADVAMYRAKERGKGGVELFEPSMQQRVVERHLLKVDLETAVRERRLHVAYQPVVDLRTRDVVAVEALVRWDHPVRGAVPPSEFIPLAEDTGLIHQLGLTVLEAACTQVSAWQRLRPGLGLAVNISGRQLRDTSFPAAVAAVLDASGLDARLLTLEVTETVMVTEDAELHQAMHDLRERGCRLAIDDFGTGYSSFATLGKLPVDTLKIAMPLVEDIGRDRKGDAVAEAMVVLGRTLGLTTVAEGIESTDQADRLEAMGCDLGQGYLYARPLPAQELEGLLVADAGAVA